MSLMGLHQQVLEHVPEASLGRFSLSFDPNGANIIPADEHLSVESQSFKYCQVPRYIFAYFRNGDIVHLKITKQFYAAPPTPSQASSSSPAPIKEDYVDTMLRRLDGKIVRGRDSHYCQHGAGGMCSHCMPLEPYDSGHQKEKGIKHLSFHAHLRKLNWSNKSSGPALEEANFKVKKSCSGHPPYPEGICTKCQPSAIILNTQAFRMVDHVEVDSPKLIEDFLGSWRRAGYQRFGWLLGRYDIYDGVPLGIKAVVHAIYEPPQDGSVDGFQILEDPNGGSIEGLADSLGLSVIGMIYTDLTDDGSRTGKVLHKRSNETFFVSSAEVIFMAHNQLSRPSPCIDSATGKFSSKFVTVIITGNENSEIDFTAFQVSNIAEAMVETDIIEATTDQNLMMVKPSIPKQHYVPEVIYKLNDEYGNTVQRTADPFFPIEYLLLTLSHGFPINPAPFFKSPLIFPALSEKPSMTNFKAYVGQADELPMHVAFSNFNLLQYIVAQGLLSSSELDQLCRALINRDEVELHNFAMNSGSWATLMTVAAETEQRSVSAGRPIGKDWTCPHCTFINVERTVDTCEMCGLPGM